MSELLFSLILANFAHAIIDADSSVQQEDIIGLQRLTVRLVEKVPGGKYQVFCSGVATGATEIVSAGHCLYPDGSNREKRNAQLHSGAFFAEVYDRKTGKMVTRIPLKDGRAEYTGEKGKADLAQFKLGGALPGDSFAPLAIGQCQGKERVIVGFGRNQLGQFAPSAQVAQYSEVEGNQRQDIWNGSSPPNTQVPENVQILSSKKGTTCDADSGGPIFCRVGDRWAVSSVVSTPLRNPSETDAAWQVRVKGSQPNARGSDMANKCRELPYLTNEPISSSVGRLKKWRNELYPEAFSPRPSRATR